MKKNIFIIFLIFLSFSCKPENPWVKKLVKTPLHADSTAMYKIAFSQLNKFEEDSSTYQALMYYTGKNINGFRELYVDFPNFGFTYYKIGDSAFVFNKKEKKYFQSNLKTDSLLYYTDIELQFEIIGPIFMPVLYQPGVISTKAIDFVTDKVNCIGLKYKTMPVGPLMSLGYEMKMSEMFAKPCTIFALIDTINYCFTSLYLKMDSSKIMGNNPISISYQFDKCITNNTTNDSIRQIIENYRKTYKLAPIDKNMSLDFIKDKIKKITIDSNNQVNTIGIIQNNLIPFQTINGDSIRLSDFKGKYILLDFWFTNCPACMLGIPKVNKIFEMYKNRNLMVLGINTVDKNIKAINDVVVKRDMKYIACKAPKAYEKLFNVQYFPTYVLLSPDQKSYETINLSNEEDLNSFIKLLDKKLK